MNNYNAKVHQYRQLENWFNQNCEGKQSRSACEAARELKPPKWYRTSKLLLDVLFMQLNNKIRTKVLLSLLILNGVFRFLDVIYINQLFKGISQVMSVWVIGIL